MRIFSLVVVAVLSGVLSGCAPTTLTGEFIRDTFEASRVTEATFPTGTRLHFQEGTIGFSNFATACQEVLPFKSRLVTLWNEQDERKIARLEAQEKGENVDEERPCGASDEAYASVTLVHNGEERLFEDCSGILSEIAREAETNLQTCVDRLLATAQNTDEIAFRYCREDKDCRLVQPISGLNQLPVKGMRGCDCSAAIHEKYRDVWYKFRADRDEGRAVSCGSCELAEKAICRLQVCVPV